MTDLETFAFGDSPALADELLALVLAGKKTATCWAASEGDRSLGWWRRAHTNYFTRRGEFAPGMEVYCERFRLVEVIDAK